MQQQPPRNTLPNLPPSPPSSLPPPGVPLSTSSVLRVGVLHPLLCVVPVVVEPVLRVFGVVATCARTHGGDCMVLLCVCAGVCVCVWLLCVSGCCAALCITAARVCLGCCHAHTHTPVAPFCTPAYCLCSRAPHPLRNVPCVRVAAFSLRAYTCVCFTASACPSPSPPCTCTCGVSAPVPARHAPRLVRHRPCAACLLGAWFSVVGSGCTVHSFSHGSTSPPGSTSTTT